MGEYVSAFISCSSDEKEFGTVIKNWIQKKSNGFIKCFLSDIKMGANWKNSLKTALKNHDVLISIMTEKYQSSKWAFVEWTPFWISDDKSVFITVLNEDFQEQLFAPMKDGQIANLKKKDEVYNLISQLFEVVNIKNNNKYTLSVSREETDKLTEDIIYTYQRLNLRGYCVLSSAEDINKACELSISNNSLHPISISDDSIYYVTQDISTIFVETNNNTVRLSGYIENAGTFKLSLNSNLANRKYLVIKTSGTNNAVSRSFDKLFKLVLEVHTEKIRNLVLYPHLKNQQNSDDEQYTTMVDSYFIYNIDGIVADNTKSTVEFVFWKLQMKDLRLSIFTI